MQRVNLDAEGVLVAQRKTRKKRKKSRSKSTSASTKILYLFDAHDKVAGEDLLAKEIFGATKRDMIGIGSWDDLAKVVKRYSSIERLILSFHGYGGGLIVGSDSRYVDEKKVLKLFKSSSGSVPTKINKINFVGCNVGGRPAKMANFAKIFGASRVTGYNWYMVRQEITMKLFKGTTSAELKGYLAPYADFVRPKVNYSALAARLRSRDQTVKLLIMYGARSYSTIEKFPLESRQKREYKPVNEARKTEIPVSKAATLQDEFDDAPVSSFQRVTVKLK